MIEQVYNQVMANIALYEQIAQKAHRIDADEAKRIVNAELSNYLARLKMYMSDPKNKDAQLTIENGVNIFLEVMQAGLSFSSIANHVYISRMKGSGLNITYKVTADGEIYLAQKSGAIDHCSEPVLVWRGEMFSIINTPDGRHVAQHQMFFDGKPKFSLENMIAGYVYVVYPDGSRELSWLSQERLKELRAKSQNPAMYDDESFIQTKIIKHALRKVRKTPYYFTLDKEEVVEPQPQPQPQQQYHIPNIPNNDIF